MFHAITPRRLTRLCTTGLLALGLSATAGTASASMILTFQEGVDGYTGTADTHVTSRDVNGNFGGDATFDMGDGTSGDSRDSLIRFDDIFGNGAGQISPSTAPGDIVSASLTLMVTGHYGNSSHNRSFSVYRMLEAWDEGVVTWNSMDEGVTTDDSQAASSADYSTGNFKVENTGETFTLDLTDSVKAWLAASDPAAANLGIAVISNGARGFVIASSENSTIANRPELSVEVVPEPASLALMSLGGLLMLRRRRP